MGRAVWIVAVLVVVALLVSLRSLQKRNSAHLSQRPDPSVYLGLRNLALQDARVRANAHPSNPNEPYAALMDWGIDAGTATVVAYADGTASVYLSSGGGFLGGGQSHESIRNAAKQMLESAGEVQTLMRPTTVYPLPPRGQVTFYVRTDAGVLTASASTNDLRTHRSPFYKLGDSAQAIITAYRLMQEGK